MEKLKIIAYKDVARTSKVGEIEVGINPSKYSTKYSVSYTGQTSVSGPGTTQVLSKVNSPTCDFQLIFDGTGIAYKSNKDVAEQLEDFKKLIYDYNGDGHQPNHLVLIWGRSDFFQGVITSFDITFTLFKPNGVPLRATSNLALIETKSPKKIIAEANQQSPDMSHIRVVTEGDTLPLMAYRIYGDSSYYLEVARVNKLKNFRDIKPGDKLTFPPLRK
ncbi:hypothetical protein BH09BAC1_BH09BAC1_21580 [soil metagenome]